MMLLFYILFSFHITKKKEDSKTFKNIEEIYVNVKAGYLLVTLAVEKFYAQQILRKRKPEKEPSLRYK